MSLEDVRSTASLGAENGSLHHGDDAPPCQGQDRDVENKERILLDRIASLSLDTYDASAFTGRFTKIQSRSRKRTRILEGRRASETRVLSRISDHRCQSGRDRLFRPCDHCDLRFVEQTFYCMRRNSYLGFKKRAKRLQSWMKSCESVLCV